MEHHLKSKMRQNVTELVGNHIKLTHLLREELDFNGKRGQ